MSPAISPAAGVAAQGPRTAPHRNPPARLPARRAARSMPPQAIPFRGNPLPLRPPPLRAPIRCAARALRSGAAAAAFRPREPHSPGACFLAHLLGGPAISQTPARLAGLCGPRPAAARPKRGSRRGALQGPRSFAGPTARPARPKSVNNIGPKQGCPAPRTAVGACSLAGGEAARGGRWIEARRSPRSPGTHSTCQRPPPSRLLPCPQPQDTSRLAGCRAG